MGQSSIKVFKLLLLLLERKKEKEKKIDVTKLYENFNKDTCIVTDRGKNKSIKSIDTYILTDHRYSCFFDRQQNSVARTVELQSQPT